MMNGLEIRESVPEDAASIEALYPEAFPDEDLLPLVRDLLQEAPITLSLIGVMGSSILGHVIFTRCGIVGNSDKVALLGPLAIAPACQRQGIGRALVGAGLERLKHADITKAYVLGDPAYYGRLGFQPERHVVTPYPLPAEWQGAWQSINLGHAEPSLQGRLSVPSPWRQPALWTD